MYRNALKLTTSYGSSDQIIEVRDLARTMCMDTLQLGATAKDREVGSKPGSIQDRKQLVPSDEHN